jgi:hypothetical protein
MNLISLVIKHPNAKKDCKIIVRHFANTKIFSIETANLTIILEVGGCFNYKNIILKDPVHSRDKALPRRKEWFQAVLRIQTLLVAEI